MATKTLKDLFHDQLQDAYSAETQLTKALPKMAKAANSAQLKAGFEEHLTQLLPRRILQRHLIDVIHRAMSADYASWQHNITRHPLVA